jgi:23S rRNA pseudouridine1911/1915/1917 synthase
VIFAPNQGWADNDESDLIELFPTVEESGTRLDKYLAEHLPDVSRSYLRQLIDEGRVQVDGTTRKPSHKVTPREQIVVEIPPPRPETLIPEPIPLDIVYEDDDVIVLNKPPGLVVHPAPGHPSGTLVNALLAHDPTMAVSGTNRPGIVHRLDKDTSGLMVVAKHDRAKLALVGQLQERTVEKGYVTLVRGVVAPEEGTIDVPIERDSLNRKRMTTGPHGRPAITRFRARERFSKATLLDVQLETGRTHQIRVHLAFIGHPVVGDPLYNRFSGPVGGRNSLAARQFLHAARLGFRLPNGRQMRFEAEIPNDLHEILFALRRDESR